MSGRELFNRPSYMTVFGGLTTITYILQYREVQMVEEFVLFGEKIFA